MIPTIIDAETGQELWRAQDCATHCVSAATWRSYVRYGRPPAEIARLGAFRLDQPMRCGIDTRIAPTVDGAHTYPSPAGALIGLRIAQRHLL